VADGHLPSAVFAVANPEETLAVEAVGPAPAAGPDLRDSIYLLASITKPIVATGILQLVERGAILLHEPIAHLWPEFAANGKEGITLWHLLTHTSGLDESYSDRLRAGPEVSPRVADAAALVETGLIFRPGSAYRYCNAAFRVMAILIERLSGQPYPEYLHANVLEPAGMIDTTFAPAGRRADRAVEVLDMFVPMPMFVAAASPAGGYWSTAADLLAFGQAYLNQGQGRRGRILGPAGVAAATRIQYRGNDDLDQIQPAPVYRGLGWGVVGPGRSELVSLGAFRHGGATGTLLLVDPVRRLVLTFLTNRWDQDNRWRDRAINAFFAELA
jgi:CubicO group peptidase (beta-lactamase class C family)